MDTNNHDYQITDFVLAALEHHKKPVMFRKICNYILSKNQRGWTEHSIRQTVCNLTKTGVIVKVKIPNRYSFYAKPEWVRNGKVLKELNFHPYYNKETQ